MTKKVDINTKENSTIEIIGEIPAEDLQKFREQAVKNLSEKISLPGFRQGHVPENVLEGKYGSLAILEEMAQLALASHYPRILLDNKIDALGQPEVAITKLAENNPLGFKITTAVLPQITLPDYQKIAKEYNSKEPQKIDVEEKEIDEVIEQIQKQYAQKERAEKVAEGEKNGQKSEKENHTEEELPEITDEFAKNLGDFESVSDLRDKIRQNLVQEKTWKAKDKSRAEILDAIMKEIDVSIPEIVVKGELDRMLAQIKTDVSNMGMPFEKYLEHIKKTEDDLKETWKPEAEKKAKAQLVINKISEEEKLVPDKQKLEDETKKVLEQHKDADPNRVRAYVAMVLTNEKAFELLESLK